MACTAPFSNSESFSEDEYPDDRVAAENIDGIEPRLRPRATVSDTECQSAGLPVNPEFEEELSGEYHLDPEHLKRMLEITSLDVITRQEYERDLEKSELFYGRQKEWDREFKMFLDVYQSKLFVAMREGQVRTYGRKLPRPTIQEAMDLSAPESWEGWNETEWTRIRENFWSSERINWEECRAEEKGGAFALILVDCKDLFRCFPIPDGKPIIGVYEIGDALVLGGEKQGRGIIAIALRQTVF